jgi:hypothetical protein
MRAFKSIVLGDEFVQGVLQVVGAKQNQPLKALSLDRLHEAFANRIHIWCLDSSVDHPHPGFLEDVAELRGELGIAVEDQAPLVAQEALARVGEVSRNLRHECRIRARGHARDLDESARVMDHEQHVVRHQPADGPNIDGEEVGGRNHTGVCLEERAPRGRTFGARGKPASFNALPIVDLATLWPSFFILDAAVAPAGIVLGHADDEVAHRLHEPWPADAVSLIGVLRREQLAVPAQAQDGVGGDAGGDPGKQITSEDVALGGESAPLSEVESDAAYPQGLTAQLGPETVMR